LSDTRLHKGPLEVVRARRASRRVFDPVSGPALEWTLDGRVARVDDAVERCTFDDYES
jgi:hypothetical protein